MNNEINMQNKLTIFINLDIFLFLYIFFFKNDIQFYIKKYLNKMVKQINHIEKHADSFYNFI